MTPLGWERPGPPESCKKSGIQTSDSGIESYEIEKHIRQVVVAIVGERNRNVTFYFFSMGTLYLLDALDRLWERMPWAIRTEIISNCFKGLGLVDIIINQPAGK